MVQTVQKRVEILQSQFWDKVVDTPLVCNVASSMAPHLQSIDKVGYMCLSFRSDWCRWSRQCSSLDGLEAG